MASSRLLTFLSIFIVLQTISAEDILSPLLSPFLDDVCKEVECGKGKCKASFDYTFSFICECEVGWKQNLITHDKHLRFLPCVIPNCTLDYDCSNTASPPAPEVKRPPQNESFFDPCYWAYCGEGSCMNSTKFGHNCECNSGYSNLLNVTAFPCFRDCSLGANCANLGITVSNKSSTETPNLNDNASSILSGKFPWLVILMITLALVPWK